MENRFSSFVDLAAEYRRQTQSPDFIAAFGQTNDLAIYDPRDDPTDADMPDPDQAKAATELVMASIFDLFRDTRLEPYGTRLAWGFAHAFHKVAQQIEGQEDHACPDVRERMHELDYAEVANSELEKARTLAQSLTEARDAVEAMRDYAAACYLTETGHPWLPARGS